MQAILQNPFLKYLYGFLPTPRTLLLASITFLLGMTFAYGTISFVDGEPSQLEQSWQDQWVRGVEARYRTPNADIDTADQNIINLLAAVDAPTEIVERLNLGDAQFRNLVQQAEPFAAKAPARGNVVTNYLMPVVWTIVFAIVYTLLFFVWAFIVWPFLKKYLVKREDTVDKEQAAAQIAQIKEAKQLEAEMASSAVDTTTYGEPIIRKASIYQKGFGNYDDSFNIETDAGMYYGEAGGTISEKVGDGATAIEIWMFDKDEFANTPTAIFASEYAFNDPAIKSRLEPKGDVIKVEKGAEIILETAALYVQARVLGVEYDEAAEMPNSVFKKVTTEVIAWAKSGGSGGAGGSTPPSMPDPVMPMPTANPVPPPPMPMPPTPPAGASPLTPPPMGGGSPTPLTPPPLGGSAPNPPEDPFGGTGDFTPVNPNQ